MNPLWNRRIELFAAWSALAYVGLLFIGWWPIAGFYPMHEPSAGPDEIAQLYAGREFRIALGMVVVMWSAVFYIPFGALIAQHVAEIEGKARVLTYTVIMAAFANAMLTFYPPMWWVIATFRGAERGVQLLQMLNDAGWIQFLGALSLAIPINLAIALAAFMDKRPAPVFPRWVGFFNLWVFVLLLPSQMLFFFRHGPFAWNGIIAIGIPLSVFAVWFPVMFYYLRRAALRRTVAD